MSRKIKYRVWDNENKSYEDPYSYAYYALTQDGGLDFYCHGDRMDEADPDVYFIEQCTGLKDKNGKEIYEGDIVEYDWYIISDKPAYRTKEQVVFDDMGARLGNDRIRNCSNVVVIGNIHENPELLKEEE